MVAKPFGSELIVLLITPAPLFDSLRPDSEPQGDYLRAVEKQLTQLAGKYGQRPRGGGFRADHHASAQALISAGAWGGLGRVKPDPNPTRITSYPAQRETHSAIASRSSCT